jgi:hypothetical protein
MKYRNWKNPALTLSIFLIFTVFFGHQRAEAGWVNQQVNQWIRNNSETLNPNYHRNRRIEEENQQRQQGQQREKKEQPAAGQQRGNNIPRYSTWEKVYPRTAPINQNNR